MKFQAVPANYSDEIPTFSKWVKTVADETATIPQVVEVIWLPNLYNNYTLQTRSYRFRVPKGHPYYEIVENYLSSWIESGSVLVLTASNFPKATLELEVLEDSIGNWEELGDAGYKIAEIRGPSKTDLKKTRIRAVQKASEPSQDRLEGASS